MNRAYPNKINWTNEPSHATPIDETNLGLMDEAIYEIDGRVVTHDSAIASQGQTLQNHETEIDVLENGKVDKVTGKGLSTNDFTDNYKKGISISQELAYDKSKEYIPSSDADFHNVSGGEIFTKDGVTYGIHSIIQNPKTKEYIYTLSYSGHPTHGYAFAIVKDPTSNRDDWNIIKPSGIVAHQTLCAIEEFDGSVIFYSVYHDTSGEEQVSTLIYSYDLYQWTKMDVESVTIGLYQMGNNAFCYTDKLYEIVGLQILPTDLPYQPLKIAYGGGRLVVLTSNRSIYMSYDGIQWKLMGTSIYSGDIIYGNGIFLIYSYEEDTVYVSKEGGYIWETQSVTIYNGDDVNPAEGEVYEYYFPFREIGYAGGIFFGTNIYHKQGQSLSEDLYGIWTSKDGYNWEITATDIEEEYKVTDNLYNETYIINTKNNLYYPTLSVGDAIDTKVDKVTGKGLSTNDYTDTEKQKLANIESNAQANVQSDWNEDDTEDDGYIKNKPNLSTSQTATGNPLTIESSESNLVECKAEVECVQEGSGDPSPENIRAITGQTEVVIEDAGKNLFDVTNALNGYIDANGEFVAYGGVKASDYLEVEINKNYTLSYYRDNTGMAAGMRIAWYDKDKNFIRRDGELEELDVGNKSITATCPNNGRFARISLPYTNEINKPQLELGNTASDFEPYKGKTYRVEIGQKNKLPMTVDGIKSANTSGTWNGNVYTINGITFTILTDSDNNVIGIRCNGQVSDSIRFYIFRGSATVSSSSKFNLNASKNTSNYDVHVANDSSDIAYIVGTSAQTAEPTLSNTTFTQVFLYFNSDYSDDITIYPMIRNPIDDSEFVPYNPSLPDAIYGAELDVITGELRVDKAYKTISEISGWADATFGNVKRYSTSSLRDMEITGVRSLVGLISNKYETISDDRAFADCPLYCIYNHVEGGVYIHDQRYNSLSDFLTAEADTQIVYPLAEPYTIQLTPQQIRLLKGTNNISCNTGDLSIKYYPDNVLGQLKGDIEKGLNAYYDYQIQALWDKINELQA